MKKSTTPANHELDIAKLPTMQITAMVKMIPIMLPKALMIAQISLKGQNRISIIMF